MVTRRAPSRMAAWRSTDDRTDRDHSARSPPRDIGADQLDGYDRGSDGARSGGRKEATRCDISCRSDQRPLNEAEFDPSVDQSSHRSPSCGPVSRSAEQLLPYLRHIDERRVYTSWGPLALELEERLCRRFSLLAWRRVSASSGTSALTAAVLTAAGRAAGRPRVAIVPALTFVATAVAAESCGYTPRIADVDGRHGSSIRS